jgi:hypothetical protein
LFQGWVVANHKSFKCLTSYGNLHESQVRNLLNNFRIERFICLWVLSFFCMCFSSVLYFTAYNLENKKHIILFIEKPKNPINDKISIFPWIISHVLFQDNFRSYSIKSLLDFSKSIIVIPYINYILVHNF